MVLSFFESIIQSETAKDIADIFSDNIEYLSNHEGVFLFGVAVASIIGIGKGLLATVKLRPDSGWFAESEVLEKALKNTVRSIGENGGLLGNKIFQDGSTKPE